jgi:hypothetical protein
VELSVGLLTEPDILAAVLLYTAVFILEELA